MATTLYNLASLYAEQDQYAKAEALYQRALPILQATLPSDHPDLAQAMENYAVLLGQLNRDGEAKAWQAKANAARHRHAGTSPGGNNTIRHQ
ncbi:MAG: tetratricopeptide repeat protein [Gammaproteobacteria bacterium]